MRPIDAEELIRRTILNPSHAPYITRADVDAQPELQNARKFQGIVVEYPSISTYPEYKGKPYFSIKYTEDGQGFIGYGTYNPDVLSEYLKTYFMPFAQQEIQQKGESDGEIVAQDCQHGQEAAERCDDDLHGDEC